MRFLPRTYCKTFRSLFKLIQREIRYILIGKYLCKFCCGYCLNLINTYIIELLNNEFILNIYILYSRREFIIKELLIKYIKTDTGGLVEYIAAMRESS